jgi:hypothetical protein
MCVKTLLSLTIISIIAGYSLRTFTEGQKLYLSTKEVNQDIGDKWVEVKTIQSDRHGLFITSNDLTWEKNWFSQ